MFIVAKRSPISATAEHLFLMTCRKWPSLVKKTLLSIKHVYQANCNTIFQFQVLQLK